MERFTILAPALLGIGFLLVLFFIYCVLVLIGRTPEVPGFDRRKFTELLGPFLVRFIYWVLGPVERGLLAAGFTPNIITTISMLLCAGSGAAIGTGHLATGSWLYALAGITDMLDGRLARLMGKQTKAGALFDSVSDRWGELFVFAGCAWYLRDSGWLMAVMLGIAGSMMVSYTRARGEGLGLQLDGGMMQRAERVLVVSFGTMIGAWFATDAAQAGYAPAALGTSLVICGGLASITALGRWLEGYRELARREAQTVTPIRERAPEVVVPPPAIEPNPMRITGEHRA